MTPNEAKCLQFLREFIFEKGFSPSYEEIGAAMGWRSKSQTHATVHNLHKAGFINKGSRPRSIQLLDLAAERKLQLLRKAGDRLSVAAQTSGGTAGRDDGLVAAIDGWKKAVERAYG